ncbi:MAG: hypothetical protein AAB209_06315, partial [Bacteroidota bacterium]
MMKTKLIMAFLAVLVFAGIAISQENVEQAVRVRLTQTTASVTQGGTSSTSDEITKQSIQQFTLKSNSQIEALGSAYAFGRSASQVEAL